MDYEKDIPKIAIEVCDLLQMQLDTIKVRTLAQLTPEQSASYRKRKSRIAELRGEIQRRADSKRGDGHR
jgi:hypothetical protein